MSENFKLLTFSPFKNCPLLRRTYNRSIDISSTKAADNSPEMVEKFSFRTFIDKWFGQKKKK
jgi:hypothetical protein